MVELDTKIGSLQPGRKVVENFNYLLANARGLSGLFPNAARPYFSGGTECGKQQLKCGGDINIWHHK